MTENKKYIYTPMGVCSSLISIEVDGDNKIASVEFTGGCDGNTHGIENLVKGMPVSEVISRLKGIDCKGRGTSCPDQLVCALEAMNID